MSFRQGEHQLRHRRDTTSQCLSPAEIAPSVELRPPRPRGCCRGGFAALLSIFFSNTAELQEGRLQQQVKELKEEVRRQKDLKLVYKARMESMQEYIRYCLEIVKENGLLENITRKQQMFPAAEDHRNDENPEPLIEMIQDDPHLKAIRDQAELHGWSIQPHEIELHEKIGQGTTADIHRGRWRGLDVAVKCIHPVYFLSNERSQSWFAQELETLSRQRHPFIVRFMGACIIPPDKGWVVTELLTGKTLTEWLHGDKQRKKKRAIELPQLEERIEKAIQISQAMEYLHGQRPKVIHRDLKPSNILLDRSMHVRVADFGHARFLLDGEYSLTGEMGTYLYMAPEVIRCEPYDEKCDVYSFGIILNELITGRPPYIDTDFGPCKIALGVGNGLRPKLPEDDLHSSELLDLIQLSWDDDASNRPSFSVITFTLRNIQENLAKQRPLMST